MQEAIEATQFCSDVSREAGEELRGSAPRVGVWVLLEYDAPWNREVIRENRLPPAAKELLKALAEELPYLRVQFIRRVAGGGRGSLTCYVVLSREREPVALKFEVDSYRDLLALDLGGAANAPQRFASHGVHSPLYLVCTHGSYDSCCGRRGVPVARAMEESYGVDAWQTTHLGGHRFSPNLVCLPHGVYYGRVSAEEVGELVSDYEEGLIALERLRGRCCYAKPVQAAEYFLRLHTGKREIEGFTLLGSRQLSDDDYRVEFDRVESGSGGEDRRYSLHLGVDRKGVLTLSSCSDSQRSYAPRYRLLGLETSN